MKSLPPIRKAVFPAAGLGTRFLPATKAQPKEMLPLVDKPIIQYVIEEAVASGIRAIVIVTGRGKTAIENHFDVACELEQMLERRGKTDLLRQVRAISDLIDVSYVRQKEPLGLGHAILTARDLVGDEPFAVFLADDVIDSEVPVMRQMIDIYERHGSPVIGVERVSKARTQDYGIVAARRVAERLHRVTDLVEKPAPDEAPSDLAIIGRYILTPDVFGHLERTAAGRGGEIQLTDALRRLVRRRPIHAYRFTGRRFDTGDKLGFLQATVEFALKREEFGDSFREYLRGLDLDALTPRTAAGAAPSPRRAAARQRARARG